MTNFESICKMTQKGVKDYMKNYLTSHNYKVINEDGFLYAKGDIPVLLVAHMDTVHKNPVKMIVNVSGTISSPQGIGGDDRCGIYIISQIVKELHCSVLLCEDEEKGGIGAHKFTRTKYIKDLGVNYMIEFDRRGNNDAVFYSCANDEFIDFVCYNTGYKESWGTFSDISVLMPASGLCGVNLSSGYNKEHTTDEYVVFNDVLHTIDVAKLLIEAKCDKPFEYKKKTYDFSNNKWYQPSMEDVAKKIQEDTELELEVIYTNEYGEEKVAYVSGATKMECWFNFFTTCSKICCDDIIDYSII